MILFLDIDGVLNAHEITESGYCTIEKSHVKNLNYILNKYPDIKIVISSAWRYLILTKQMTLSGFENMLLSFGLCVKGKILDILPKDNIQQDRVKLILKYIKKHKIESWFVIDDLELDFPDNKFIKCTPNIGLDIQKRNELELKIENKWIVFTKDQIEQLREVCNKAKQQNKIYKERTRIKPGWWHTPLTPPKRK